MKSICVALVCFTLLCPLVVYAKPTELAEPYLDEAFLERYQEILRKSFLLESCAETLRDDLRPIAEEFGGWVLDVFNRIGHIIEIRRSCDAIEMSDPPTRWELIQREACELRFQGIIIIEIARLNYEITVMLQTYPAKVRKSIERYVACSRDEVPDYHDFHQMIASMHRY
ncbi:uncharacterized protein LOC119072279 [Bradysia coprophila]|uniref:uncharacterized protein LOC119072279 n=1 Tax=Bradysia coprophila TaxID=38358 RepID=UPI00187DABCB|nr:uncharacterized protein LOC119072279 [Bradysia coprophila]